MSLRAIFPCKFSWFRNSTWLLVLPIAFVLSRPASGQRYQSDRDVAWENRSDRQLSPTGTATLEKLP